MILRFNFKLSFDGVLGMVWPDNKESGKVAMNKGYIHVCEFTLIGAHICHNALWR